LPAEASGAQPNHDVSADRYGRSAMHAVYYRAADGSEPVNDFIDRLDVKRQVALDNQIERLNMLTKELPHLPYPHSSQIEGELRELRCHFGRELYRILPALEESHRPPSHLQEGQGEDRTGGHRSRKGALAGLQGAHGCWTTPSPACNGTRCPLIGVTPASPVPYQN
jgi:hypothetical protein